MATTLTGAPGVTPNAFRQLITWDTSAATTALYTQAALIAACAAGPLKQFLQGLSTAQFNALGTPSAQSVTLQVSITTQAAVPVGITFSAGAINAVNGTTAGTANITLRFIQSDDR